ncbi:DISARM system SNF2-like helicase DrmD [Microbispora hainanensis]|uniref:DISARM system SNF2-like helicase DrmD n=1 Tax=Microbispora hainanensis TaxID=568844 RepID=UPI0033FA66B5
MTTSATAGPERGELVWVRGEHWIVTNVDETSQPMDELSPSHLPGRTMVTLMNVTGEDIGESLRLIWELEPGHRVVPGDELPEVAKDRWDDPQQLGAFLDAVRWGTVASADPRVLQAPFRSGITIYPHQLAPVAKALAMPRVNLLIADDVGLGKTIEAGLVIQEMLLRHRARRVMVVCPAPLTIKWREEMADKFGLDFVVLDSELLKDLKRTYGLGANPFTVYPRIIISLQWLRTPRVGRLLDEVLTSENRYPGFFDLLVVDEVHHCAPAAPRSGRGLAKDSQQTRVIRRVGEHSQHRLFLSATPHNGYPNSWQALLEMLDPQRFTRGMEPDESLLDEVMIRRLKTQLRDEVTDELLFRPRNPRAIEVNYSAAEKEIHGLLERFRRAQLPRTATQVRANDLMALLLKKRLFSSPAAFNHTLQGYADTLRGRSSSSYSGEDDSLDWLDEAAEWDTEVPDDEPGSVPEQELMMLLSDAGSPVEEDAQDLVDQMLAWCDRFAEPADSKANALVAELKRILAEDDQARVIIFTEYRATQTWLAEIFRSRGLGGELLGLLHGGMDEKKREHLKAAFQAAPHRHPLRILLATDSASEGIDLQNHCHRLIHYDIPFNPNRLEQRIGRVDRQGQTQVVDVAHFIDASWETAPPGSFANDLEYLTRVARKIAVERRDLGSVNPVLAQGIEEKMLGRPTSIAPEGVEPMPDAKLLRAERNMREHAQQLRTQLHRSEQRLHVAPANVRRVVDTGLTLAEQPALLPAGDGKVTVPELRHGWERTLEGINDPLNGERRPLTFDGKIAHGRDDVVHAHLEHPLVAHSSRLLRSAMWAGHARLHRVSAVRVTLPEDSGITDLLVTAFARLVVVGADGRRLHEEVMPVARAVPAAGRSRQIDLGQLRKNDPKEDDAKERLRRALENAFEPGACLPAPEAAQGRLVAAWSEVGPKLAADVKSAAEARLLDLERELDRRQRDEKARVEGTFSHLEVALRIALDGGAYRQMTLDEAYTESQPQVEWDREAWQARLDTLDEDRQRELRVIDQRYRGVRHLVFPFAVALCVPDGWEEV